MLNVIEGTEETKTGVASLWGGRTSTLPVGSMISQWDSCVNGAGTIMEDFANQTVYTWCGEKSLKSFAQWSDTGKADLMKVYLAARYKMSGMDVRGKGESRVGGTTQVDTNPGVDLVATEMKRKGLVKTQQKEIGS